MAAAPTPSFELQAVKQALAAPKAHPQETRPSLDSTPRDRADEMIAEELSATSLTADDPVNPRHWPKRRKMLNLLCAALLGLISPLASTIISPGLEDVAKAFDIESRIVLTFTVSIYVLGYAFGQVLLNPLTEVFGRLIVQHLGTLAFILFNIGCALSRTQAQFLTLRFFAGFSGSGLLSIGGGSISDMFNEEERGGAMAIFILAINLGPIIGPVIAGYLTDSLGFRWMLWIVVILAGATFAFTLIFLEETYAPVIAIRETRLKRRGHTVSSPVLWQVLKQRFYFVAIPVSPKSLITDHLSRPLRLLVKSPVCALLSVAMAMAYGYLYLLFTSFGITFINVYREKPSSAGLNYLAFAVGTIIGLLFTGAIMDKIYVRLTQREADATSSSSARGRPEFRIPLLVPGAILMPCGLLLYGWAAQRRLHFIVADVGIAIFGFSFMSVFMSIQLYLLDAFKYVASATGAANMVRCLFGAFLPLAGPPLFENLGIGWGCSLLALVSAVIGIPMPYILWTYGQQLRSKYGKDS